MPDHVEKKISEVFIWDNGNVMVFGDDGQQIPEYQGFILEVAQSLSQVCSSDTIFYMASRIQGRIDCDFAWWFMNHKGAKAMSGDKVMQ